MSRSHSEKEPVQPLGDVLELRRDAPAHPEVDVEDKDHPTPSTDDERYNLPPQHIPFKYRAIAFSMIIFFATGSSYADGVLSPLKSTLRKELKITNAQYGAITSAANLINTVLPIIGGIGMDYWGAT